MNAFITGIAGFVGGHLAEHLLDQGEAVLGTSLSGQWDAASISRMSARLQDEVQIVPWDITQPATESLVYRLQEFAPTTIYHLAAVSKADDGTTTVATDTNIAGTRHVLDLAKSLPSRPRVLFISSSYVYGEVRDTVPVPETAALSTQLIGYGFTKRAGEQDVRAFVSAGYDAVIARAFQHAGPRQSPRFMLAEWCEQLVGGGDSAIEIRSSETWIDLSDVRDVVRAYRLLVQHGERGEIYNVGSGIARRTGDLFAELCRIAQSPSTARPRSTETRYTPIADIRKITAATGWQPQIPLEQTIADTYAWFRE